MNMASAVALSAVKNHLRTVTFRFDARRKPSAGSVSLVGPFNRWDTSVHRLTRQPEGWWTVSLTVVPGKYPYLFIVDGEPWNDLEDDGRTPCEWGGEYSIRVVR
jgi:1,4-alpha-glucan branching enzyme